MKIDEEIEYLYKSDDLTDFFLFCAYLGVKHGLIFHQKPYTSAHSATSYGVGFSGRVDASIEVQIKQQIQNKLDTYLPQQMQREYRKEYSKFQWEGGLYGDAFLRYK